jgi:hypothetical protein
MITSGVRMGILAALALAPRAVFALDFCTPVQTLHEQANFCEDDLLYVPAAADCAARYRALVQAKKAELQNLLAQSVGASASGQKNQLDTTKSIYASAAATLQQLLATGAEARARLVDYEQDFVPPTWPWRESASAYELAHDPGGGTAFREFHFCFGEPMTSVDASIGDVDQVLGELRNTLNTVSALHQDTSGRDQALAALSAGGPAQLAKGTTGRNTNSASDITGVTQQKRIDSAPGTGANAGMAARNSASAITAHGNGGSLGVESLYPKLNFLNTPKGKDAAAASRAPSAAGTNGAASAGSALWAEDGGPDALKLAATGAAGATSGSGDPGAVNAAGSIESVFPAAAEEAATASPLADADTDLFTLIHRQYRKREQRRAGK